MPIGDKPVLELLLRWLRRNAIRDVCITTGPLGHLIRSYCGNGQQWDLRIKYTQEREPLGTMGALRLLRDELDTTFLVLNGDVVTDLNLNALAAHHHRMNTGLTVATVTRSTRVDFGLIEEREQQVVRFREKPVLNHMVSMGVYCLQPEIVEHIPDGVPFGFDDLMFRLLELDLPIGTFQHDGLWLDVGQTEDFQKAQELDLEKHAPAFGSDPLPLGALKAA
jgi:mannose-1-phosphate guanylyltransferase